MAILARRSYWLGTVTLTLANTNYSLVDLINAALASANALVPGMVRELQLQASKGIDGSGQNTNDILVGDGNLSTANFGASLNPGGTLTYRSNTTNTFLAGLYVRSAGAGQKLNVALFL